MARECVYLSKLAQMVRNGLQNGTFVGHVEELSVHVNQL